MRFKSLAAVCGLLVITSFAHAANPNYGTYSSDGFLFGFANTNTEGYIKVWWTAYASPFTPGVPGLKLKVWSQFSGYFTPYYQTTFYVGGTSGSGDWQVNVPAGYYTNVEMYATGNQFNNSPSLNKVYYTYSWIRNQ